MTPVLRSLLRELLTCLESLEPAPCETQPTAAVSESEADILRVCQTGPYPAKILAKLLGRKRNSYLRCQLARLVRSGLLTRTPTGYKTR